MLARHLKAAGIAVAEVERPKRRHLRRRGKSDPIDAEEAARTVLAGQAAGEPKCGGRTEMIRALRSARRSAVKARSQAANQLQSFVVTAPEGLRHRLRRLSTKELVAAAARFRPGDDPRNVEAATKLAMRSVARRHEALSEEIAGLDAHLLRRLMAEAAPGLISLPAIGTHHAATLLVLALKTTRNAWAAKPPSPAFVGCLPWKLPPGRSCDIVSIAAATATPIVPCT
jgi:transposase